GVVVTSDDELAARLRLLRNHGLSGRDEVAIMGCNSRLDTLQAIVGNWLIGQTPEITQRRIQNAARYDERLGAIPGIRIPPRRPGVRRVFHLYMVFAEDRDGLMDHCLRQGVEAKIHYPIPLYQQEGLRPYGYQAGDFPISDRHAGEIISFPADQHLSEAELDCVVATVREFYGA
ncbi:MAG: DegT/DnrJ/EryC1/StrS family aminotransferase, partial [Alphaproteobacteria bacterium]|nr:DegT/DnrJ/EryC1/StrS family aminotransferase [Alphaproteobacteria bacterium]